MNRDRDRYIGVGGVRTRYWEKGTGDNLILLHGLGASVETWAQSIDLFARHFHVFAPDLIGFGYTDKPDRDYTLQVFTAFVQGWMDALDITRAVIVGHSLGGLIALRLTIESPKRVEKLVVVDAAGLGPDLPLSLRLLSLPLLGELLMKPSRSKTRQALKGFFYDESLVTDEMVELNYDLITQPNALRAYLSTVRNLATPFGLRRELVDNVQDRLGEIRCPTLVVWGKQDPLVPVEHSAVAADQIPNASRRLIDECGHNPMIEKPDRFNEIVLDFLT